MDQGLVGRIRRGARSTIVGGPGREGRALGPGPALRSACPTRWPCERTGHRSHGRRRGRFGVPGAPRTARPGGGIPVRLGGGYGGRLGRSGFPRFAGGGSACPADPGDSWCARTGAHPLRTTPLRPGPASGRLRDVPPHPQAEVPFHTQIPNQQAPQELRCTAAPNESRGGIGCASGPLLRHASGAMADQRAAWLVPRSPQAGLLPGRGGRLPVPRLVAFLPPGSGRRHTSQPVRLRLGDRKSTRLNSSHMSISYAVFCLKKKKKKKIIIYMTKKKKKKKTIK